MATLALVALAGCAGAGGGGPAGGREPAPAVYEVRRGDTLFGIARRFGLDPRDIARWNALGDGSLIYPGQRLSLRGSGAQREAMIAEDAGAPVAPLPGRWQWPTAGEIVAGFGASPRTASGIMIAGRPDQPVRAAADGEVVYAGTGLAGYGPLVIVRHNEHWLSAYGHNRQLLVSEGERVSGGQQIARMGSGAGREAVLHFEIRRDGRPVDPLRYLPSRRP